MNDLCKICGVDVYGFADIYTEVDIQVILCREILCGAVGGPGTSKGHLHGVEFPYVARHCKVQGPDLADEAL